MGENQTVRGRFAPSPSGRMHLGNVFCALMSWLFAKSAGGEIVLRIEDLDTARCRPEYTAQLLDDLRFLGLTFDEGEGIGGNHTPYRQSLRSNFYEDCLQKLQDAGEIYPCYCSRDELHASNAPHASDGRVLYNGACRNLTEAERLSKTRKPAFRLKAMEEDVSFVDILYGPQTFNVKREWGDFVVRRSDGLFAYQLAVVADDIAMGVNQVVRGADLLTSVAPQIQLYRFFDAPPPQFCHIPMLIAPDGRRLSKRDRDLDMGVLRDRSVSPEALIGYLLYKCGVLETNKAISLKEAVCEFSLSNVCRQEIVIDVQSEEMAQLFK